MSSPRCSIPLQGGSSNPNPYRLALEQRAVPTGALSLADLEDMVAMARSGISATAYLAKSCPATVVDGNVVVPLTIYVWPSHGQEYLLTSALPSITAIGEAVAIEQPRDFDLIIASTDSVDLPCLAKSARVSWQSPAILANGKQIEHPDLFGYDLAHGHLVLLSDEHGPINRLHLARSCFGVLRVRCTAVGYSHALTLTIPKGDAAVDFSEVITANWTMVDGSIAATTLELSLPACVETLLAACEDDTIIGEHTGKTKDRKTRKQLRYSTCTGAVIDYREIEVEQ